jgi:hypothetical protein
MNRGRRSGCKKAHISRELVMHKRDLSGPRQRLVEMMQQLNYGRVEGLFIKRGEPLFDDAAPRTFVDVKFGAENGPRKESAIADFALRAEVIELFAHFDQLQHGRIDCLTVKRGLPFSMSREDFV